MFNTRYICFIVLCLFSALSIAAIHETLSDEEKAIIMSYVRGGEYDKDIEAVLAPATTMLQTAKAEAAASEKLAVVFDVDYTALSPFEAGIQHQVPWDSKTRTTLYLDAKLPMIAPVYGVYKAAKEMGYHIFFITARHDSEQMRQATALNLVRAGYTDYSALYLHPVDELGVNKGTIKRQAREHIESEGYTIVLMVGDKDTDFEGGHFAHKLHIPNPFDKILGDDTYK